jgi:hypothetical protein
MSVAVWTGLGVGVKAGSDTHTHARTQGSLEEAFKAEVISAETKVLNEQGKEIPLPVKA